MTMDEISLRLEIPVSSVCARMDELKGVVLVSSSRRPTRYGKNASVYVHRDRMNRYMKWK